MWDLATMKRMEKEKTERYAREWRGAVSISDESSVDSLHPIPYLSEEIDRAVFFASNKGLMPSVTEGVLKDNLKKLFREHGSYTLFLYSKCRFDIRLVLWFG